MGIKSASKKSKKLPTEETRRMTVTIAFGYGLFLLVLASVASSIISWYQPVGAEGWIDFGTLTVLLIAYVVATVMPGIIGYLAGDAATKSASKGVHHYNGVLFGALGVWIWLGVSSVWTVVVYYIVVDSLITNAMTSMLPMVFAAVITIAIAIAYARSPQVTKLITYKPYWLGLVGALVLCVVGSAGSVAFSSGMFGTNAWESFFIYMIVPVLFTLSALLVSYWILGKANGGVKERFAKSMIALAFAILATIVATQFSLYFMQNQWSVQLGLGFACIVWLSYLIFLRKAVR